MNLLQAQDAYEGHAEAHLEGGGHEIPRFKEIRTELAALVAADAALDTRLDAEEAETAAHILILADHTARIATLEAEEVVIYQSAGQQLTSNSTTMQTITGFALPLAANEVWRFSMTLIFISSLAADFKMQFALPAGALLFHVAIGTVGGLTTPQSGPAGTVFIWDGLATNVAVEVTGTVICGGTPGNMQLQAAQNSATVEIIDFLVAGTNMVATRVKI